MYRRGLAMVPLLAVAMMAACFSTQPAYASHANVPTVAPPTPAYVAAPLEQLLVVTPIAQQQLAGIATSDVAPAFTVCLLGAVNEQVVVLAALAQPPCTEHTIGVGIRSNSYQRTPTGTPCNVTVLESDALRSSSDDLRAFICSHSYTLVPRRNLPPLGQGTGAVSA